MLAMSNRKIKPVKLKQLGKYFNICVKNVDETIESLDNENCKQLCLNDLTSLYSLYAVDQILNKFESKFPEKLSFEI